MDTGAYTDGIIPPYYDSLVAKLIVHGRDREAAIARMKRALRAMFVVEGIYTTIPLHERILQNVVLVAKTVDMRPQSEKKRRLRSGPAGLQAYGYYTSRKNRLTEPDSLTPPLFRLVEWPKSKRPF